MLYVNILLLDAIYIGTGTYLIIICIAKPGNNQLCLMYDSCYNENR